MHYVCITELDYGRIQWCVYINNGVFMNKSKKWCENKLNHFV